MQTTLIHYKTRVKTRDKECEPNNLEPVCSLLNGKCGGALAALLTLVYIDRRQLRYGKVREFKMNIVCVPDELSHLVDNRGKPSHLCFACDRFGPRRFLTPAGTDIDIGWNGTQFFGRRVPSIVVQSGTSHNTSMDRAAARTQWSLSTQSTYEDDADAPIPTGDADHIPPSGGDRENDTKTELKLTNNNIIPRTRSKANLKLLKRSHAIKESTSPPPDIPLSPVATSPTTELPTPPSSNNNNPSMNNNNNNGLNLRPIIKREGSNQSSDSNWSSSLSRGNSMEQANEQPPLNLEQFLSDTINGHAKDRILLLRIENELISFIKDPKRTTHKFGTMSSYQRMLAHRVAHYYGIDHNVDPSGHMVVVTKAKSTKMPLNRLTYFIRDDCPLSEEPKKSILKRDSASFEDTVSVKSPDRHNVEQPRRSKSFEEREEEYEKARARIFHEQEDPAGDEGSQDGEDDLRWSQLPSSWDRTESSDSTRLHPNSSNRPSRMARVESYESRDTLRANSLRSSVSKSYSFGGYDQSSNNKVLTKQDSGSSVSSRVSPSSSGYKSQSQRSDTTMSATPSPSATPHLTTQTGQPFKNEDGSVYHYDPENPPKLNTEPTTTTRQPCENGRQAEGQNGVGRSLNDSSGSSESSGPVSSTTLAPAPAPAPSYHQAETANHTEPEPSAMAPAHMPYHHMPPPAPATVQHMAAVSTYPVPVTYNPPAAQYSGAMQPVPVDSYAAPTNTQHVIYSVPFVQGIYPSTIVQGPNGPYDRGMNAMVSQDQDLSNYLMNLSVTDNNRLYVCHQQSPMQQPAGGASGPAVPMYYTPHNPAPPPQPPAYPSRYGQCTYQQYPQPSDHTRTVPECNYPQTGFHSSVPRCPSTPQVGGATGYCGVGVGGAAGAAVAMGVTGVTMVPTNHMQPARQYHRLSTPPNTPQNGCTPYPIYTHAAIPAGTIYQHYPTANPPTQIVNASLMRPTLQNIATNSPPMRGSMRPPQYNTAARSPVVRDSAPSEPPRHAASPLRYAHSAAVTPTAHATHAAHAAHATHVPPQHYIYRFPFPTVANEYLIMNNNRAAFSSPPAATRLPPSIPYTNTRRNNRPRAVGAAAAAATNGRPVFTASQQQAALATAIESAGHNDPRLNGRREGEFRGRPYGRREGEYRGRPYGRRGGEYRGRPYGRREGEYRGRPYGRREGEYRGRPYGRREGEYRGRPYGRREGEYRGRPYGKGNQENTYGN